MVSLNQKITFFYTLSILILMFMADTNSAARIYSSLRPRLLTQGGGEAAFDTIASDRQLNLNAFYVALLKGRKIIPSGPSHRGNITPNFHKFYSVPSPGIGN
ncbi:conserved hypothetical protein [Ricinus communis]|uniref:Uncharacterized protein n=1 Tax=Ricinus communis TaxID=3988 RepID=B9S8D4_RICCO|nr:conserved hypothetical protein [Ricinus communis]